MKSPGSLRVAAPTGRGIAAAFARTWQPAFLGLLMLIAAWGYVSLLAGPTAAGFDFRGTVYDAAMAVASGESPFPLPGSVAVATGAPAVYPPLVPAAAIPLTWLGWTPALVLWSLVLVACVAAATWLLGVRDWRCYCIVFGSVPVVQGVFFGNVTLLLLLGVAIAWRLRERPIACGVAVGFVIAAKLFLWPLVFWLLLTRRSRGALVAVSSAVLLIVIPWSLIGFGGLADYPDLLREVADLYGPHTYSLLALGEGAGLSPATSRLLPALAVLPLLCLAGVVSRRPGADRRVFGICVVAALAASPIVWNYYLALHVAPVAVLRSRLSWLWLVLPASYLLRALDDLPEFAPAAASGALREGWIGLQSPPPFASAVFVAVLLTVVSAAAVFARSPGAPTRQGAGGGPDSAPRQSIRTGDRLRSRVR